MSRNTVSTFGLAALAAAVCLGAASPADAARWRGGWGGYYGGWGGYRGWDGGYRGWGGYGYGYRPFVEIGVGYSPYSGGYYGGYGYPSYSGSYAYSYPSYSYYAPSVAYAPPTTSTVMSFYPSAAVGATDATATIHLRVPANAEVLFNGKKTSQTGAERVYNTPPLTAGEKGSYDVTVRWTDADGKEQEITRNIPVKAGDNLNLDLTRPEK